MNPLFQATMYPPPSMRIGPTQMGAVPPVYNPMRQATAGTGGGTQGPTAPVVQSPNLNNNFGTGDPGVGVPGPQAPADAGLASTIGLATTSLGGLVSPGAAGLVSTMGSIANALSPGVLSGLVSVNGLSTGNVTADVAGLQNNSVGIQGPTSLGGLVGGMLGMGPSVGTSLGQQAGPAGGLAATGLGQAGQAAGGLAAEAANAGGDASGGIGAAGAAAGDSFKKGGKIPGKMGQVVPIKAHAGEYIINAKTAMEYGTKYLDKLNKQKIKKGKQ